jgi:hypothetical protein
VDALTFAGWYGTMAGKVATTNAVQTACRLTTTSNLVISSEAPKAFFPRMPSCTPTSIGAP